MEEKSRPISLSDLAPGTTATIKEFDEIHIPVKMLEMGLLPGYTVMVKRLSPFGDPMHIHIAGTDIALRKDEANYIRIDEKSVQVTKR